LRNLAGISQAPINLEFAMMTLFKNATSQDGKTSDNLVSTGQYLTLRLGKEEYAIDILNVQEIRSYETPTKMSNSAEFVKGVINLRGAIVTIVDLRLKFNLKDVDYNDSTIVVVLVIDGTAIGIVVDSVADVVTINAADVKPAPHFEARVDSRYVMGLVSFEERMLIIMSIKALLRANELGVYVTSELAPA
jgi:purine-binding chemotaxis protein CheW